MHSSRASRAVTRVIPDRRDACIWFGSPIFHARLMGLDASHVTVRVCDWPIGAVTRGPRIDTTAGGVREHSHARCCRSRPAKEVPGEY